MAISRVTTQDARAQSTAATATATYPATPTQGNLLVATAFSNSSSDALAISGWTKLVSQQRTTISTLALFYKLAGAGESTSVQVTGGNTVTRLHIYEYTGNANPISTDGSNSGADTTGHTSWPGPSITTTNISDLVFAAFGMTNTNVTSPAVSNSFGLRQADASAIRLFDGDRIVGATGSYSTTASWTTSAIAQGVIAAFKAAPVTGSATIAGTGSLSATGSHTGVGAASPAGSGALTATGKRTAFGAASLTGTGTLAATGLHTAIGSVTLTGSGAITATGSHTAVGVATLTGSGSLTASGYVVGIDSAELSGSGTLAASGFKTVHGAAALSGSGSLAATATRHRFGSATTQGTGGLVATGQLTTFGAGVLTASGSLSATGTDIAPALPYGQLPDRWFPATAVVGIASPPAAVIGIARPPGRFEP